MHIIKIITFTLLVVVSYKSQAQSTFFPLNKYDAHLISRYEILNGQLAPFHAHIMPNSRKKVVEWMPDITVRSYRDQFNLSYLKRNAWEWSTINNDSKKGLLNQFYQKQSDFYHFRNDHFDVHLNPVLHIEAGKETEDDQFLYTNTRGIELRGMIDKKVGFYTYLTDTQASFPGYVRDRIKKYDAIPGEGYYKDKDLATPEELDFLTARGYIHFNASPHIQIQFGQDKNFIGSGYRSLVLSDYSSSYPFLKINANFWKINYQSLFAQMTAEVLNQDGLRPKKYFAHHHLSVNVTPNLNIGLFESVVFGRKDSLSQGSFDWAYLNPIIFYRFVEQQLGSPDNVLIGADFKWIFLKKFSLYGQLVIDDWVLSEIRANKGWWGNKWAAQLGLKYINVANIPHLDLQIEANLVRPYTYAHENNFKSYSHYQQALAHPLGANFKELLGILNYQAMPRLNFRAQLIYINYGDDEADTNWGNNILADNRVIEKKYGNNIGQGVATHILFAKLTSSYQLKHNLFIDWKNSYRKTDSAINERDNTTFFTSLSIRLNISERLHEF